MSLITLIVIIVVIAICLYIFARYVMPALPAPWGTVAIALFALVLIIILLQATGILNVGSLRLN